MLQLRLHCDNSFDNDTFYFTPNLLSIFAKSTFFSNWLKLSFQDIAQSQLVSVSIEVIILFVETVISQVDVWVICLIATQVVRFAGQSHKTIFVQKDSHGIDYASYENINSKIVLVTINESWFLDILLNNITVFFHHYLRRFLSSLTIWLVRHYVRVNFCCVVVVLSFQVFVKLLFLSLKLTVQLLPHIFDFTSYENAPSLTTCIRLANQEHWRIS